MTSDPQAEAVVCAFATALLATPANVASILAYAHNQLHRPASGAALLRVTADPQNKADTHLVASPSPLDFYREGVARLFPARITGLTVLAQHNAVPLKTDREPRAFGVLSITFVTGHAEEFDLRLDDTFFHSPQFWRRGDGADFDPLLAALGTMMCDARRYWTLVSDASTAAHLMCSAFLYVPLLNTFYSPAAWLLADTHLLLEECGAKAPTERKALLRTFETCRALQGIVDPAAIRWAAGLPKAEDKEAVAALHAALLQCKELGDVPRFMTAFDALIATHCVRRMRQLREARPRQLELLPNGGGGTREQLRDASLPVGGDERDLAFTFF
jgi:hypothetical protein